MPADHCDFKIPISVADDPLLELLLVCVFGEAGSWTVSLAKPAGVCVSIVPASPFSTSMVDIGPGVLDERDCDH